MKLGKRRLLTSDDDSDSDSLEIIVVKRPPVKKRKLNPKKKTPKTKSLRKSCKCNYRNQPSEKRRSNKITTKDKKIKKSSKIPRRNSKLKSASLKSTPKSKRDGTLFDHFHSTSSKRAIPTFPNTEVFLLVAKPCSGKSTFIRKAFNLPEIPLQTETDWFHPKNPEGKLLKSNFKYHKIGEDTYVIGDYSYQEDETRHIGADRLNRAITISDHLRQLVVCKAKAGAKHILYETNHILHDNMNFFRKHFRLWFLHVKLTQAEWQKRFNGDPGNQELDTHELKKKYTFHKSVLTSVQNQKFKTPPKFTKNFANFVKVAKFMDSRGLPIHTIPLTMRDFKP